MNALLRTSLLLVSILASGIACAGEMAPRLVLSSLIPNDRVVTNINEIPALGGGVSQTARNEIPVMVTFPSNLLLNRIVFTNWTAFMVDLTTGAIVPNATMVLGPLQQKAFSGGHDHDSPARPNGSLSVYGGNTGPTGLGLQIDFMSPEVSGVVFSAVNCSAPGYLPCGPDNFYSFTVRRPDLVQVPPSSSYDLIGATETHRSNHWATVSFANKLQRFASAYFQSYGARCPKIAINDISLIDGGLFDVKVHLEWRPPHREHRIGMVADMRTPPRACERFVRYELLNAGIAGTPLVHVPPDPPHWHIREFQSVQE